MKYVIIPIAIMVLISLLLSLFRTDKEESFYNAFEEWFLPIFFCSLILVLLTGFVLFCIKFWNI